MVWRERGLSERGPLLDGARLANDACTTLDGSALDVSVFDHGKRVISVDVRAAEAILIVWSAAT